MESHDLTSFPLTFQTLVYLLREEMGSSRTADYLTQYLLQHERAVNLDKNPTFKAKLGMYTYDSSLRDEAEETQLKSQIYNTLLPRLLKSWILASEYKAKDAILDIHLGRIYL